MGSARSRLALHLPDLLNNLGIGQCRNVASIPPLIATALLAATGSGYVIALYILFCAIVSIVATALMPDYTNQDISEERDKHERFELRAAPASP